MTSLHIEHPITDLATWRAAFAGLAEVRRGMGVQAEQVRHRLDDERYVVIDLEFDTAEHAAGFLRFLETQIWAIPENSPALVGRPVTQLLEAVDVT
jgi:hypothetical protein